MATRREGENSPLVVKVPIALPFVPAPRSLKKPGSMLPGSWRSSSEEGSRLCDQAFGNASMAAIIKTPVKLPRRRMPAAVECIVTFMLSCIGWCRLFTPVSTFTAALP